MKLKKEKVKIKVQKKEEMKLLKKLKKEREIKLEEVIKNNKSSVSLMVEKEDDLNVFLCYDILLKLNFFFNNFY